MFATDSRYRARLFGSASQPRSFQVTERFVYLSEIVLAELAHGSGLFWTEINPLDLIRGNGFFTPVFDIIAVVIVT